MKKKCKRKVWALVNPIEHALEGCRITSDEKIAKLRKLELDSIEAFRIGNAGLQEWTTLTHLCNLTETMARGGIGPEALPCCATAEQALIDVGKRFERTGSIVLTAQGLTALRDVYEYADLQRQCISQSEYERWIRKTMNRIKSRAPEVRDMSEVSAV